MTPRARFDAALAAAQAWHSALPAALAFCDWPDDLTWADRGATPGPAAGHICANAGDTCNTAQPLLRALQSIAGDVEWRHTYTQAEVGQHFLDHFGWFELAGPEGHFTTHQARITVGYWGPGLDYPRHDHLAEELYTVVSGEALFMVDGEADQRLTSGDTRYHASAQPHALITEAAPVLTLVFWRGDGLDHPPRMST